MYDAEDDADGLQPYAPEEMYSEMPDKRFGIQRFGKKRAGSTKMRRAEDRLSQVRL